jgi:hypothetical protein
MLGILLTLPFAAAYFRAYPGFDAPPRWLPSVQPILGRLLTFAPAISVYTMYGRLFEFVYLLILPGVFGLHALHARASDRFEQWGFWCVVGGLIVSFVGVAGDYWADGAGFTLELVGLLVLLIGTTIFGSATVRARRIPTWSAWLLIIAGPGALPATWFIGHLPSGPTFLFAFAWVIIGYMLWQGKGKSVQG